MLLSMKLVCVYDSMCMYVCRALKNYLELENSQLNKFCAVFNFCLTLAINIMEGDDLSNKTHHDCLLNETKAMLWLYSVSKEDAFKVFYISTKVKRFSYKGEWAYS